MVLNNFVRKRNIAKSKDRISDCDKGKTSVAYRRIGTKMEYGIFRSQSTNFSTNGVYWATEGPGPVIISQVQTSVSPECWAGFTSRAVVTAWKAQLNVNTPLHTGLPNSLSFCITEIDQNFSPLIGQWSDNDARLTLTSQWPWSLVTFCRLSQLCLSLPCLRYSAHYIKI